MSETTKPWRCNQCPAYGVYEDSRRDHESVTDHTTSAASPSSGKAAEPPTAPRWLDGDDLDAAYAAMNTAYPSSPRRAESGEAATDEELISNARNVASALVNNPYHQDQEAQKNAAIRLLNALSSRLAQLTGGSTPDAAEWLHALASDLGHYCAGGEFPRLTARSYADDALALAARLHSGDAAPRGEEPTREKCANGCTYSRAMGQPTPRLCVDCGAPEPPRPLRCARTGCTSTALPASNYCGQHQPSLARSSRSGAEATSEDTAEESPLILAKVRAKLDRMDERLRALGVLGDTELLDARYYVGEAFGIVAGYYKRRIDGLAVMVEKLATQVADSPEAFDAMMRAARSSPGSPASTEER